MRLRIEFPIFVGLIFALIFLIVAKGHAQSFTCQMQCTPNTIDAGATVADAGKADAGKLDAGVDAGVPVLDSGMVVGDAGVALDAGLSSTGWLKTQGNKIVLASTGQVAHLRGFNLNDERSCASCAYGPPSTTETMRRGDFGIAMGANLIRLGLECYSTATDTNGTVRTQWQCIDKDPAYAARIQNIVSHFTDQGVYVLVSEVVDPTYDAEGWPTTATYSHLSVIAKMFAQNSRVLFGVGSEPIDNYDGTDCGTQGQDCNANAWKRFNDGVNTIRTAEIQAGSTNQHLVTVAGLGGWSRILTYYQTHPITAGGGTNVLYAHHGYADRGYDYTTNLPCTAQQTPGVGNCIDMFVFFEDPAKTLPVIIEEMGNASLAEGSIMTLGGMTEMIQQAEQRDIPWTTWIMHDNCPPNLLLGNPGTCNDGKPLNLSPSGLWLKDRLSKLWGAP